MAINSITEAINQINIVLKRGTPFDKATGPELNMLLKDVVGYLSTISSSSLAGVATPATNPGLPTKPLWYLAASIGTYTNFKDASNNPIMVTDVSNKVIQLVYGGTSWSKIEITIADLTAYVTKAKQSDDINAALEASLANDYAIKYIFSGADLPTTGIDGSSGAVIAPNITQVHNIGGLNVISGTSTTSDINLYSFNTGIAYDSNKYSKTTLAATVSTTVSVSPAIGFGYIAGGIWKGVLFRTNGSIITVTNNATANIQAATPANQWSAGATIRIEIELYNGVWRVRCWNGVVWSAYYTLPGWNPTGNSYVFLRGRANFEFSANFNVLDLKAAQTKNYIDSATGLLQNQIDQVVYGALPDRLAAAPYTATACTITGSTATTVSPSGIQVSEIGGLKINAINSAQQHQVFDTDIPWDASKHIKVFTTISAFAGNPALGAGFGDPVSGTLKGAFYRQNGQIFGFSWSGSNVALAGWVGIRAANPTFAFTAGAKVEMDFDIPNLTVSIFVNGEPQTPVSIDEIPVGNIKLLVRDAIVLTDLKIVITSSTPNENDNDKVVLFVDKVSGNDGNNGKSKNTAFATISKALNVAYNKDSKIFVYTGDYREILDFTGFKSENIEIIGVGNKVRILGSDSLNGWSKTSGKNNIYQIPFTGFVPAWTRESNPIFEDGNPSAPILDDEVHPLQKGLSHRLPYTLIKQLPAGSDLNATLGTLDVTPGRYYIAGGILYLHASDSSNPVTNGFSYENIVRNWNVNLPVANLPVNQPSLILKRIGFYFGLTGFIGRGFSHVTRYNCIALAAISAGCWRDDACMVISYQDEAGGSDNDGLNGHYSAYNDYATQDIRTGNVSATYYDAWCHDNYDDGCSHHERHEVSIYGMLSEYNGDSGMRPSTGANYRVYNALLRKNGWEVNKNGPSAANGGEGIACVNPVLDGRRATSAIVYNSVSENNNIGFGVTSSAVNRLLLIGCTSRNNLSAEIYANQGSIKVKNSLASNNTPANIKVQTNGGAIIIENDQIII